MKKPEEIKAGLRCHAVQWHIGECPDHEPGCKGCPYDNDYHDTDELMADAYELVKDLEKNVPQWISVEERLPSISGKYIVCTEKGSVYSTGFRVYGESGHFQTDINTHITHWMPMPAPPEEEE